MVTRAADASGERACHQCISDAFPDGHFATAGWGGVVFGPRPARAEDARRPGRLQAVSSRLKAGDASCAIQCRVGVCSPPPERRTDARQRVSRNAVRRHVYDVSGAPSEGKPLRVGSVSRAFDIRFASARAVSGGRPGRHRAQASRALVAMSAVASRRGYRIFEARGTTPSAPEPTRTGLPRLAISPASASVSSAGDSVSVQWNR